MRRREFITLLGGVIAWPLNLKTAKALGLNIPNTLIGRADVVIE